MHDQKKKIVKSHLNKDSKFAKNIKSAIIKNKSLLISEKNNTNVKTNTKNQESSVKGNQTNLDNFIPKNSASNRCVVLVKNISKNTKIDNILSSINDADKIAKHSSIIVRNRGIKTQLLTIAFKTPSSAAETIKKLNGMDVDGNKLIAEFKNCSTEADCDDTRQRTNKFVIKNLPLSSTKVFVEELLKDFEVSPKDIQMVRKSGKNTCLIKFKSVRDASEAAEIVKSEVVDGVNLSIKFVSEKKENTEEETVKTKLHITNLPFTVTKKDMENEFDMADSIKFPLTSSGKSKGCCYLIFKSEEMASLAKEAFQEKIIGGRKIKCEFARVGTADTDCVEENLDPEDKTLFGDNVEPVKRQRSKKKQIGASLTLSNLPEYVTVGEVLSHFVGARYVDIERRDDTPTKAVVHFKDAVSANKALSGPSFSLQGRIIHKEIKKVKLSKDNISKKTRRQDTKRPSKTTESQQSMEM